MLLEVEQAGLDVAMGVEVVGRNDFTLDDGKVDPHLIEPRRVDGQVDQTEGGPAVFEPVEGGLSVVGGAIVDHPEHPAGRVVLAGHHLANEPVEWLDAGGLLAAAEHLGAVHVPGGHVGQRAAAGLFVLHTHRPPRHYWGSLWFRHGLGLSLAALRGHRVGERPKRQYRVVGQLHTRCDASGVEHLLLPMVFVRRSKWSSLDDRDVTMIWPAGNTDRCSGHAIVGSVVVSPGSANWNARVNTTGPCVSRWSSSAMRKSWDNARAC